MSDINYDKNEPNSLIIGLFVGGTLLILAVIFVFSYYFFVSSVSKEMNNKYSDVKTSLLDDLNKQYEFNLNRVEWVDENQGTVKVSISHGIDYIISKYSQN
tara:strand:- start:351 stop:653 length:303 start_codon:yes stop_codon:yes gene_type:complete